MCARDTSAAGPPQGASCAPSGGSDPAEYKRGRERGGPYSPACERNRDPILAVLREHFADRRLVLEIGSGTGQHAVHFASALPHLTWQATDRAPNLPGIRMWLDEAQLPNTPPPIELDVNGSWPPRTFDAVFTANTLHIMGWDEVVRLFDALPRVTVPGAVLTAYGPFNYGGAFTSASNAAFDARLKEEDARQGIRDFEAVEALARRAGFSLVEDRPMPANNRTLVFRSSQAAIGVRWLGASVPTSGR